MSYFNIISVHQNTDYKITTTKSTKSMTNRFLRESEFRLNNIFELNSWVIEKSYIALIQNESKVLKSIYNVETVSDRESTGLGEFQDILPYYHLINFFSCWMTSLICDCNSNLYVIGPYKIFCENASEILKFFYLIGVLFFLILIFFLFHLVPYINFQFCLVYFHP